MTQCLSKKTQGRRLLMSGAVLALLAGCVDREEILEGQRFDLRTPLSVSADAAEGPVEVPEEVLDAAPALRLSATTNPTSWTHRNGSVQHRVQHPALSANPSLIWSTSIGEGNSRKHRITATPVAANGRIFTLDSRARVTAVSTGGAVLWTTDMTPSSDASDDASGGGLALGGGLLFATTGFGALVALDPATGRERWRQRFDDAVTGSPTVSDGLVYVVSRDGQGWAIDVDDGRIKWQMPSVPAAAVRIGGAGPVIDGQSVVFPFGSGEVVSALKTGGLRVWSAIVSGERRGRAYATLSDLSADPVIDGSMIYTGNPSGRLVALDKRNGKRVWTATEGAIGPVWPDGGSLFFITDENNLIRLDAATGEVLWREVLPYFVKEKIKRRKAIYPHFGPLLAGGTLWVASGDDVLRGFDPENGQLRRTVALPGGAASGPIVVNRTLYVVTRNGQLAALR